jgi:adenine-specific DNA-methyltransferase
MARARKADKQKTIEHYDHKGQTRMNNPHVGLVNSDNDDGGATSQRYQYDPHLDPQLVWAGKAERTSFEVPTVSLHVHERIDPRTVIEAVQKKTPDAASQPSLFETDDKPYREAIEFYKHSQGWTNRLIAGDSLLVMNSLLQKESMGSKVQMIYFDPPYGIKYGSNFQPFVNKRDVKDGKDEDLTQEPEMIKAFRDTWELGIHSYLSYMRDRLLLAKELLHESGSIFVQISDENVHHVKSLLEEVFGTNNFCGFISFQTTTGQSSKLLSSVADYLLWFAVNKQRVKYKQLYQSKSVDQLGFNDWVEELNGKTRRPTRDEARNPSTLPQGSKIFRSDNLTSDGVSPNTTVDFEFEGRVFHPGKNHWKTTPDGLRALAKANRLFVVGNTLCYKRYVDDFPVMPISNVWNDTRVSTFSVQKKYVVETNPKVIERCMLMTTDPGDLVLDPTCGSGTSAFSAEQWGRRWITCDTSRISVTLAKQRLLTSLFDYYELSKSEEGISSGFKHKTVKHTMLSSISRNETPQQETLYDQPNIDNSKVRVTGPFTVEAVPSPTVRPLEDIATPQPADASVVRSGATLRHDEWTDELFKTGIRGKAGQRIEFSRVETLAGTRHLQAEAETKEDAQRVVISFGPEHAPLEQLQVERAIQEAMDLYPRPKIIVFAAFQFDPEAAKDIDEAKVKGVTLLKAQMNATFLRMTSRRNVAVMTVFGS